MRLHKWRKEYPKPSWFSDLVAYKNCTTEAGNNAIEKQDVKMVERSSEENREKWKLLIELHVHFKCKGRIGNFKTRGTRSPVLSGVPVLVPEKCFRPPSAAVYSADWNCRGSTLNRNRPYIVDTKKRGNTSSVKPLPVEICSLLQVAEN